MLGCTVKGLIYPGGRAPVLTCRVFWVCADATSILAVSHYAAQNCGEQDSWLRDQAGLRRGGADRFQGCLRLGGVGVRGFDMVSEGRRISGIERGVRTSKLLRVGGISGFECLRFGMSAFSGKPASRSDVSTCIVSSRHRCGEGDRPISGLCDSATYFTMTRLRGETLINCCDDDISLILFLSQTLEDFTRLPDFPKLPCEAA